MIEKFKKLLIQTNKPNDVITLQELYNVYFAWCADEGYSQLGKILFSALITEDHLKSTLGKNIVGFRGLKLSDELEWYLEDDL